MNMFKSHIRKHYKIEKTSKKNYGPSDPRNGKAFGFLFPRLGTEEAKTLKHQSG